MTDGMDRWLAGIREAAIKREEARAAACEARGPAKVRIPARVRSFLSGSQSAIDPAEEDYPLFRKVLDAPTRKDGSTTLVLDPADQYDLIVYVEAMEIGAGENTSGRDALDTADARADLNAARAALRALIPPPPARAASPIVKVVHLATEPPRDNGLCSYDCGRGGKRKPDYCRETAGHPLPHWSTSGR